VSGLFVMAGVITAVFPLTLDDFTATTRLDAQLRIARAALVLAPVLLLPLLLVGNTTAGRRAGDVLMTARGRALVAIVLAVSTWVAINGQSVAGWLSHNAAYVDDDAWAARYGLALRSATADDATIAVTWAGAIPYFSHRRSIDLLGKSDRLIATGPRQAGVPFSPGHDKWNYEYGIGQLHPDVVAQLWHASQGDVRAIGRSGYIQVAPWAFARSDSSKIARRDVKDAACLIFERDPFLLGSVRRSVPDFVALSDRFCP
jgi:hypothetical protein